MNCLSWFKDYDWKVEVWGGIANFMACVYVVIVNPMPMYANGAGFPIAASVTATIVTVVALTMFSAFFLKLPLTMAPGMGFNVVITYNLVMQQHLPIPVALGVIFWSNIGLLVATLTNVHKIIIEALPVVLQHAISIGLGCFLILIGLQNAHIVVSNPNTIVGLGKIDVHFFLEIIAFGFTVSLFIKRKNYAFLLPMVILTIALDIMSPPNLPTFFMANPDFSLFAKIDLIGSLKYSCIPLILILFLNSYCDATTSLLGLFSQLEIKSEKLYQKIFKRAFTVEAIGGIFSSFMGTANGIVYAESATALSLGAKTGLANVITALLFIPLLFLAPLISLIPLEVTSPTLILVGCLMIVNASKHMVLNDIEDYVPVVLTVVMMPLSYSLTAGAVFGVLSYIFLKILLGKHKEINIPMCFIGLVCFSWFFIKV